MSNKVNKIDGRHCGSCGSRIYMYHDEEPSGFLRRHTCRTETCKMDFKRNGRRYPEYKEREPVEAAPAPVPSVPPVAGLVLRRIPAWLLQPVENSV